MRRLAEFIVKKRYMVLAVIVALTVFSAFMIPKVNIVTNMSEYLPDDSSMREEALMEAYNDSIHTIHTSGLIIILLIGLVGYAFSNPTVGQICQTISKGALCATLLIVFSLPGILAVFDKLVCRKVTRE